MQDNGEIDAAAVRVYQLRVTHPTDLVDHLAARAGLKPEEVSRAEAKLSELGLLQRSPGGGWAAVSPEAAADTLLAPLEQDILQRWIAMAATRERLHALSGDYLEARSLRSAESSIEIVEGIDSIRAVIDDLARTCSGSLDALHPRGGQSEEAIRAALPLDLEILGRGVHVRTLFLHSARKHRPTVQYAEAISLAGAQVRTTSGLPSRMLIYDRSCAVLPVDLDNTGAGAALVRDTAVLGFLCRLFQHYWDRGMGFWEQEQVPGQELSGLERDVLLLMSAGKTNEAIAEELGISQRSVSRLVSCLMDRLGATSRFQAGALAVVSGWLP